MRFEIALVLLLTAAFLEAGGDALVRVALRSSVVVARPLVFGAGALLLFVYACVVNAPSWDFGRLLGVYIVCFFLVAQLIAWLAFGQLPSRAVWVGGLLIVAGGTIIALNAI